MKKNPTEWSLNFKFRDKETLLLFNNTVEKNIIKKQMNKIFDYIYIIYLYYNYDTSKYNLTTRQIINQDKINLKKLLKYAKNNFIPLLNNEYKRRMQLTGKEFKALEIIGFYLPEDQK